MRAVASIVWILSVCFLFHIFIGFKTMYSSKAALWHAKLNFNGTMLYTNVKIDNDKCEESIDNIYLQKEIEMQIRISRLQQACKNPQLSTNWTKQVKKNLYVSEHSKLMYCQVEKVASTFLKRIMWIIDKKGEGNISSISRMNTHYSGSVMAMSLKAVSKREHISFETPEDVTSRYKDYKKFLFVRDPFEKAFSSHIDKVFLASRYLPVFRSETIKRYPTIEKAKEHIYNITFEDTLRFIINHPNTPGLGCHFDPCNLCCDTCHLDFDYLGKVETISDDFKFLYQATNQSDKVVEGHSMKIGPGSYF